MITGIAIISLILNAIFVIIDIYNYKTGKKFSLSLDKEIEKKSKQSYDLEERIKGLRVFNNELLENIRKNQELVENQKESYQSQLDNIISNYQKQKQEIEDRYRDAEATYKEEYISTIEESGKAFRELRKKYLNAVLEEQTKLDTLQKAYQSRIEIAKHEQEDKDKRNYYRWQLANSVIEDIKYVQSIKDKLSNPEIIDKLLWKSYYEKATNELITRVIGSGNPCGIYKITNLLNEKVYIGQSISCRDRIKQHVKSGVGAAPASNNKLYTSIKQDGLLNFTWEIVEECPREKLNEREAYWIDFYDAAGYGMNGNSGIKN